jgi:hypothetical protein
MATISKLPSRVEGSQSEKVGTVDRLGDELLIARGIEAAIYGLGLCPDDEENKR